MDSYLEYVKYTKSLRWHADHKHKVGVLLGGEDTGAHESSNKEKLNLYLDLCNDKHAFSLVFTV
jgi:hypothetical protein